MVTTTSSDIILVTGANGQQGSATVRHLMAAGLPVRAMLRSAEGDVARSLAAQGCELAIADLDRPETLSDALQGARSAFLFLPLSDQGTEIQRGRHFIHAAKESGLEYLLFSAALDANHRTGVAHFDSKFELIQELAASGLHHSVLGPGGFMENLLYPQTWQGLAKGKLVTPFAVDIPQALVGVDDIGRFAAALLADPPEESGAFIPLYSDILSSRQQAEVISRQLGRTIQAKRLPWLLTRVFLGAQLTGMFDYFNKGRAPSPPGNEMFRETLSSVTSFEEWLGQQTLAR